MIAVTALPKAPVGRPFFPDAFPNLLVVKSKPWEEWFRKLQVKVNADASVVYEGTHAQRLASYPAAAYSGRFFIETNRDRVCYVSDGSHWKYFGGTMGVSIASTGFPGDLSVYDVGFLCHDSTFDRTFQFNGFVFGEINARDRSVHLYCEAPSTNGYALCDGSTVTRSRPDGTVYSWVTPNLAGKYAKFGSSFNGAIAAVAPSLSIDAYFPAGTFTHHHGINLGPFDTGVALDGASSGSIWDYTGAVSGSGISGSIAEADLAHTHSASSNTGVALEGVSSGSVWNYAGAVTGSGLAGTIAEADLAHTHSASSNTGVALEGVSSGSVWNYAGAVSGSGISGSLDLGYLQHYHLAEGGTGVALDGTSSGSVWNYAGAVSGSGLSGTVTKSDLAHGHDVSTINTYGGGITMGIQDQNHAHGNDTFGDTDDANETVGVATGFTATAASGTHGHASSSLWASGSSDLEDTDHAHPFSGSSDGATWSYGGTTIPLTLTSDTYSFHPHDHHHAWSGGTYYENYTYSSPVPLTINRDTYTFSPHDHHHAWSTTTGSPSWSLAGPTIAVSLTRDTYTFSPHDHHHAWSTTTGSPSWSLAGPTIAVTILRDLYSFHPNDHHHSWSLSGDTGDFTQGSAIHATVDASAGADGTPPAAGFLGYISL